MATSTGLLARISYDGRWNITVLSEGASSYQLDKATDDETEYSDRLRVENVEWFVIGVTNDG